MKIKKLFGFFAFCTLVLTGCASNFVTRGLGKIGIDIIDENTESSKESKVLNTLLTGNGEPSNSLGTDGDSYVDLLNYNYYLKVDTIWVLQGCIKGSDGLDGKDGADGQDGKDGSDGQDGKDGVDGQDGKDGEKGKSAYEIYVEQFPGYIWGEEQWIRDLVLGKLSITITFETFGGDVIEPRVFMKGEEVSIDFGASKERAVFLGWYKDEMFSEQIDYSFVASTSLVFYAKFEVDVIPVKFVVDDETYSFVDCEYNSSVVFPQNPEKIGFTFDSWRTESGDIWNPDSKVTKDDLVLYASFNYDFLELPVISINTDDGSEIVSKEDYTSSKMSILNTAEEWELDSAAVNVKGRGNSTWALDKKPYRLKFDKKVSLFGSSYKAKSWVLLANHFDRSLSRNAVAFKIYQNFGNGLFAPSVNFVDLYFNGEYRGVYLLTDQIQTGEGRVFIDETLDGTGDTGYFLEMDARAKDEGIENTDYFVSNDYCFVLKTPDTESESFLNDKEIYINYIKSYMDSTFDVLSGNWDNVDEFIDVSSFVDMYILQELMCNSDVGYASFYLFKDKQGKLFSCPPWDFDLSAGGDFEVSGMWAKHSNPFFNRLCEFEEFNDLVNDRLLELLPLLSGEIEKTNPTNVDGYYLQNRESFERNFDKWHIFGVKLMRENEDYLAVEDLYGHFVYLHDWLKARLSELFEFYVGENPYAYKATFNVDDSIEKVLVYEKSDYTSLGTESLVAYSRSSATGELLKDGEGQINFEVVLKEGYVVDSITVTGDYKNLKGPTDTGRENTYRITKVKSNLTITITSKPV